MAPDSSSQSWTWDQVLSPGWMIHAAQGCRAFLTGLCSHGNRAFTNTLNSHMVFTTLALDYCISKSIFHIDKLHNHSRPRMSCGLMQMEFVLEIDTAIWPVDYHLP